MIDIICHMNIRDLESQLALQCAPLIVGGRKGDIRAVRDRMKLK